MDIQTFVSETLTQIVAGVRDAETRIAQMNVGARVNPTDVYSGASTGTAPSAVEFDVAVTVASQVHDAEGSKAGGSMGVLAVVGIKVGAEISGQASTTERNEAVSRVQFRVMLSQPGDVRVKPAASIPTARSGQKVV